MTAPDFVRLVRAYLDSFEDPWIRRLRIEQELLTVARDGTVSYSYTFADYLRENRIPTREERTSCTFSEYQ